MGFNSFPAPDFPPKRKLERLASVVVCGPMARRRPKPDRIRALELLASCRDGCTEAIMRAHGFSVEQLVELVRSGLAVATPEHVVAGGRKIEVAKVRITEAGRQALAKTGQ